MSRRWSPEPLRDAGKHAIQVVHTRLPDGCRIRAISGDFLTMSLVPDTFDFVVGIGILHHLTLNLEVEFLKKAASLLKASGEARFSEPASNSWLLDQVRELIPLPNRPSRLQRTAFRKSHERDPHPERTCSSDHFRRLGQKFFHEVEIMPYGCIERFHRLLRGRRCETPFRKWATRAERHLPQWFQSLAARSQLMTFGSPKR